MAYAYPDNPTPQEKAAVVSLLDTLPFLLPCESCRLNVVKEMEASPVQPYLSNARSLGEWVSNLHNSVNRRLGKREYTYEEGLKAIIGKNLSIPPPSEDSHAKAAEACTSAARALGVSKVTNSTALAAGLGTAAGVLLIAFAVFLVMYYRRRKRGGYP